MEQAKLARFLLRKKVKGDERYGKHNSGITWWAGKGVCCIPHPWSLVILQRGVEVFCLYPGQNPQDYADQLRLKIENSRDAWIILADILGGSVHTALSQLTAFGDVTILSGMNLNLVLSVLLGDHDDVSEKRMAHIMDEAKSRNHL